ncbi:MAG TPA: benzoate-CoA ligase family protein [Rhodocyclaceae bacterium]|nr:benzoate-CoA ligase family protein [Rhodocyclaceae bacterium]
MTDLSKGCQAMQLSTVDRSVSPPGITIPRQYNAAHDLIERNLSAGRGGKVAFIDDFGKHTYSDLAARANRIANALTGAGVLQEQRILLCVHDTFDFPSVFLGAIKAGIVPVAVNTLLTQSDYEYMLSDSRAQVAVVSHALLPLFEPLLGKVPTLKRLVVAGAPESHSDSLVAFIRDASDVFPPAATTCDDACFWLYSSGSTGAPKGTVHVHSSLIQTAELFAVPMLGINENDVVFSAAKLFFAYGLGNGLTFPMAVGATAVLMAERPTPDATFKRMVDHQPTIFYGAPTGYAGMLASPKLPAKSDVSLRLCSSAGEALPEEIGKRWKAHFDADIIDGLGSTEMLHVFLSNRVGDVRYGSSGKPVPGYAVRVVGDDGQPVAVGEPGELQVMGPTAAAFYWNNRAKTRGTFLGEWTRSGDKYTMTEDGYYIYAGRNDDMLKVSGIYVSPIEVESVLITHDSVLEAAVVGVEDSDKLIKPKAYVVLKEGFEATPEMAEALKAHVKALLAPYKYPRWFEFVTDLPKTATGKIQRFKLRATK